MKQHIWTEKDELWLVENYPELGIDKCIDILNLRKAQIRARVRKLNLKLAPNVKSNILSKQANLCNVNPELFNIINTKEIAYLLGVIWSDGFLNQSKNGNNHNLGFTMAKEDMVALKPILESIGKWCYYERKQPVKTWKPSVNVITNNKRIYKFLVEHDYDKKSQISADKILSKIPDDLKHYFFRGLIDGDGCFYFYKPKKGSTLRQFALTSTYEQDWSYFESLCSELGIVYKIKRVKNINKKTGKENNSSVIRITNKVGIKKLGDFIYSEYKKDKIGLTRKYNKFLQTLT